MTTAREDARAFTASGAAPDDSSLVSVIMGVYNAEDTIEAAIQSLVDQTYPEWELVVCDDGSKDGSFETLTRITRSLTKRVVVLRNDENRRLSATLNRCLSHATGKYIARMDADDLCSPERLEAQVAYLQAHPDVHLVGTAMERFGDVGAGGLVIPPAEPDKRSLKSGSPFCHATIVTHRKVYDELGGYNESTGVERVEDIDLWFRFFGAGFVGRNLAEPLYYVREDEAAIVRRTLRNRWNLLLAMYRGYATLRYPMRWYLWPAVQFLKVLIPRQAMAWHRGRQARDLKSSAG